MKTIQILYINLIALVFSTGQMCSQIVINIPGVHSDKLSQKSYSAITKDYAEVAIHSTLQRAATARLKQLHVDYNNELTTIAPLLLANKRKYQEFCTKTSMNYIHTKYPILAANPADVAFIKNVVKRKRLKTRLDYEADRIGDYLDLKNPMSQGKRIFMILSSMEKAMKIGLEHEKF